MVAPLEEYLFDLQGFTVLRKALEPGHVRDMNAWIDALPPLATGQWHGSMYVQTYGGIDGMNLQDIIEGGEVFERLIDHPSWIERVRHYLGPRTRPFLYEIFANVRGTGGYIGVHSGGHNVDYHQRTGRKNGQWVCTMLSLLAPLNDVGPGDGATVIIPGSHKSDLAHPEQKRSGGISEGSAEKLTGAIEVSLEAGDALLFNDALCHGSAMRTNPGTRRMIAMRYVPDSFAHRFGYSPSPELEARLTPERLAIVRPQPPRPRPDPRSPAPKSRTPGEKR